MDRSTKTTRHIMSFSFVLSAEVEPWSPTPCRLASLLEHHGAANALLLGTVIDEAGCSQVLTGVPHGLVDSELLFGLPSPALAQQDLAELCANARIQTSKFPTAQWCGLEGQPGLPEEAALRDHPGIQFSAR